MCNIKITGYNDRAWGFPDRYSFIGRFFGKLRNGVFDDSDFWTISNTGAFGWTISGGLAQHAHGGAGGGDVLSQEINLSADLCYLLTAEIANVSGSGNQDISIYYDTENLTDQLLTTITVSAFPYELAVNINNLGITNIKFVCTAAGIRIFSMDNVFVFICPSVPFKH